MTNVSYFLLLVDISFNTSDMSVPFRILVEFKKLVSSLEMIYFKGEETEFNGING